MTVDEGTLLSNMSLQKEYIRIGATDEHPYVFPCFTDYPERCPKVGSDLEYIYAVLNGILHANIIWSNHPDFPSLKLALENDEIDLIGNTRILHSKSIQNETLTQTSVAYHLGIGFFIKSFPVQITLNPVSRFSWDLWVCIIFLTGSLLFIKKYIFQKYKRASMALSTIFVLWSFIMTLIMELYGNLLTTDLITSNEFTTSISDLTDLGRKLVQKECQFIIYEKYLNSDDFQIIFNPVIDKPWARDFKTAFRINPPITINNKEDLLPFVRNSSCLIGLDFVSYDLSLFDNLCGIKVKIFPDDIPFMPYVYYHRLESYSTFINNIFASESFRALPAYLQKRYGYTLPKDCLNTNSNTKYLLTLSQLYSCFLILNVGLVASATIFLMKKFNLTKWLEKTLSNKVLKGNNKYEDSSDIMTQKVDILSSTTSDFVFSEVGFQ